MQLQLAALPWLKLEEPCTTLWEKPLQHSCAKGLKGARRYGCFPLTPGTSPWLPAAASRHMLPLFLLVSRDGIHPWLAAPDWLARAIVSGYILFVAAAVAGLDVVMATGKVRKRTSMEERDFG